MTYQFSAEYAEQNFAQIIEQAHQEAEGVMITQGDKKFVLIEQSKLKNLQEAEQLEELFDLLQNVRPSKKSPTPKKNTINLGDIFG